MEQKLHFYFDDSGVLHRNSREDHFVYAGYVFTSNNERDEAKRRYRELNIKIRKELNCNEEIKACNIEKKHKRALFNILKYYESLAVTVEIDRVYDSILSDKKSICRYKDYILKRLIKEKVKYLVANGKVIPSKKTSIIVNIDEQLTASNGYYGLKGLIHEELKHGIVNHDYGVFHKPIFTNDLDVAINYCESKNNYLIQASDILANRILSSYKYKKPDLRKGIPKHKTLTLP